MNKLSEKEKKQNGEYVWILVKSLFSVLLLLLFKLGTLLFLIYMIIWEEEERKGIDTNARRNVNPASVGTQLGEQ